MRPEPFQLEPGRKIDRYELLAPIPSGDTSRVWAARESGAVGFEELVALRVHPGEGPHSEDEHGFQLEAQLASRIQHRNVARCLDIIEHEGISCSIMEWIEGRSLGDVLRTASGAAPIPLGVAVQIIMQACEGLKAVHEVCGPDGRELGWIHGELSPQSFMIDTAGTVKLVDLGIVRRRPSRGKGQPGERGDSSFVAPELARGERVDGRADVFSLGMIFYRLTTGRHPFAPARGPKQSAAVFGGSGIIPPSAIVRGYPKALEAWVQRALARERGHRLESVGEMLDELLELYPGYASEGELAALLRRLCGDSILDERRKLEQALERYSEPDSTHLPRPELSASESTSNTLSPSYFTAEALEASRVPWKPGRLAIAVATIAFVTAFALTIALSSFRFPRSAPAAQALPQGAPSPAASAHSSPVVLPPLESARRVAAPVAPRPATTPSSPVRMRLEPATAPPRKAPTKGNDSGDVLRRYGI